MVLSNLNLIWPQVNRYAWAFAARLSHGLPTRRLIQQFQEEFCDAAVIGLCRAARDYDPQRGNTFATVSFRYIQTELWQAALVAEFRSGTNKRTRQKRIEVLSEIERLSKGRSNASHNTGTAFDIADVREHEEEDDGSKTMEELSALLYLALDKRLARMATLYWLKDWSLQEIGNEYGISRERVRQLMERAKKKMKESPVLLRILESRQQRKAQELRRHEMLNLGMGVA